MIAGAALPTSDPIFSLSSIVKLRYSGASGEEAEMIAVHRLAVLLLALCAGACGSGDAQGAGHALQLFVSRGGADVANGMSGSCVRSPQG